MNSIGSIAMSGMNTAMLGAGVAANNVANALTPGYRRQRLAASTDAQGGVQATVQQSPTEGSDLAADLVGLRSASYSFKANLRVLQTSDRMLGSLLDAFA